jgi:uncharacterized protein YyaL (SSP411 family)
MTTPQVAHRNRLAEAASPYLCQHGHHPVDWYEWGPVALGRAKTEDKPIFLSIGYAACHWCHVMAHESFEDADVAAVLNAHFVNIKVDREERPDLDDIYMQATLALNHGQGGWPMSVWLTPDGQPFFAGTYFPPSSSYGRPGFKDLCVRIADAWHTRRADIVAQAGKLTDLIREGLLGPSPSCEALSTRTLDQAAEVLADAFDAVSGGLISGQSNKFPPSLALELLLRSAVRRPADDPRRKQFLQLVEVTLDHMAAGGIHDQLAGGFHRYSTDVEWHVPHFEKMLYDQALVSGAYLDAYQATGQSRYAGIVGDIFAYVLGDLRAPGGAFYSSRDADSGGVEGQYYVWTRADVLRIVGDRDGELFCAHYDIREAGNWRDPHAPLEPKNVLRRLREPECCAKMFNIPVGEFVAALTRARGKLLAARAHRAPPALDDKILVEWNGLMIASLARGGCILDAPEYVQAAAQAADFILENQCRAGRLRRSYRAGRTLNVAFLSDYANLIAGLLELYEATFARRWLDEAVALNNVLVERYWDSARGGFFSTAHDHEALLVRHKDARDGAVPAGNSVQLMNLLRLAAMLGDARLRDLADQTMAAFAGQVQAAPWSSERFLCAVELACVGPLELTVVGDPAEPETRALVREIHRAFLPNRVLTLRDPRRPDESPPSPLLTGRTPADGRPAVHVCRNHVCQPPATTAAELATQLAAWQ